MRHALALLSTIVMVAAGVLVADTVLKKRRDAYLTPDVTKGFDLAELAPPPAFTATPETMPRPAAPELSAAPVAGEVLRDAVASPGLMPRGMQMLPPPPRPEERAIPNAASSPIFQSLMAAPAKFLVGKSHLGSAARLKSFVSNPQRVERYMNWRVTRGVLDHPEVLKRLVGHPAVVSAFISSPAMRDPAAISALVKSPLIGKIMETKGAQALVSDPAFISQVMLNPETLAWFQKNPEAMKAFSQLAPNASAAMSGMIGQMPGRPF